MMTIDDADLTDLRDVVAAMRRWREGLRASPMDHPAPYEVKAELIMQRTEHIIQKFVPTLFHVAYWRSQDGRRGDVSAVFYIHDEAWQWLRPYRDETHVHMFGIVTFRSRDDAEDYRKFGLPQ